MAKFCTKCGSPLIEGQACSCCSTNAAPQQTGASVDINVTKISSTIGGLWAKFKNQIGIGDPLTNEGDAYETNKRIVPDCVKPNDSEVPVKQYKIATLKKRLLGITYTKAVGRIQVTNKRVIFRAPGHCLAGRTTLQHEFAIDEIAGVETRREYVFNIWDFIGGLISLIVGGVIGTWIVGEITKEANSSFLVFLISMLLAGGAGALFLLVKKKWALKLLGLGSATAPLISYGLVLSKYSDIKFLGSLMVFFGVIFIILILFTLLVHAIKPNLALIIKTKSASQAIGIVRKKQSLFGSAQSEKDDHTGYTDIWPEADAELSIREIGAMINDIQKLGDFGIEKWKC